VPHLLHLLKDFILFAEKDEELQKIILRQHQAAAVDKVVGRKLIRRIHAALCGIRKGVVKPIR
jgi:type I site-specific restriction-modification system R (restriction) subunit